VPIDSIVAQINADMIGRNADHAAVRGRVRWPHEHQSKRLGAILDSVNAALTHAFAHQSASGTRRLTPEHIYERSDHYSYARRRGSRSSS
jgi:hypothetical protein